MEFEVIRGDIAVEPADALVTAVNTSLRVESGVDAPFERATEEGRA